MAATSALPDEQVMPKPVNVLGPPALCWRRVQDPAAAPASVLETSAQGQLSFRPCHTRLHKVGQGIAYRPCAYLAQDCCQNVEKHVMHYTAGAPHCHLRSGNLAWRLVGLRAMSIPNIRLPPLDEV